MRANQFCWKQTPSGCFCLAHPRPGNVARRWPRNAAARLPLRAELDEAQASGGTALRHRRHARRNSYTGNLPPR